MKIIKTGWWFRDGDDPEPDGSDWEALKAWDYGSWQSGVPSDAEDAAASAANQVYGEWDYPDEMKIEVRSPDGARSIWVVTVEMTPEFTARTAT